MKGLFFLSLLLTGITGHVQSQSDWKKLDINSSDRYKILHEDQIYDMSDVGIPADTIRASIVIDTGQDTTYPDSLIFTSAELKNGMLTLSLTSVAGHSYHECTVRIIDQKFIISHNYLIDVLPEEKFKIFDSVLQLTTIRFKNGNEIRGYVEFKFACAKPCENFEGTKTVKGNFKAIIR